MRNKTTAIMVLALLGMVTNVSAQEAQRLDFSQATLFAGNESNWDSFQITSPAAKVHNILGYTTVAMGLLTGLLNPEIVDVRVHQALGYTSAGLAAATMGFGFISHMKDIDLSSGLSSNNVHMFLGIAGGTMMIIAPFIAPGETHQVLGELGAATMGLSIIGKLVY